MKNNITILVIGIIIGFILASAWSLPMVAIMQNKFRHDYGNGHLNGQADVINFLNKHFWVKSTSQPREEWEDVFSTKAGNVIILKVEEKLTVETN